MRQLHCCFGPLPTAAMARLYSITPEELDRWTDLVLDAPTMDGVLGVHSPLRCVLKAWTGLVSAVRGE